MAVRKLYNFLSGVLGAGVSETATVLDFGSPLPITLETTVDGPEFVPLVLSPNTVPEIVHLVSYVEGETTGTVLRGQEGTYATEHFINAPWGCKPLVADVEGGGGSVAILAGETPILSAAEFLRFGDGLDVTEIDFRTARVDAIAQTGIVVDGPDVVVSLDVENNLVVRQSSAWGIDQVTNDPYYDPDGVAQADVAALVYYPAAQEHRLEWLGNVVTTATVTSELPALDQSAVGTALVPLIATTTSELPTLVQAASVVSGVTATVASELPALSQGSIGTAAITATLASGLPPLT